MKDVLRMGNMPDCHARTPIVAVSARIQLTPASARVASIPGAPRRSYYEARVLEIRNVRTWAEPCDP